MTRKLLPLLLLALSAPAWGAYAYKATVTLSSASGGSDLSNYTAAIKLLDTTFKPSGSGGQIQHSGVPWTNAQTAPYDLIVTANSDCSSSSEKWEVEWWDQANGGVYIHKLFTTYSHTTGPVVYVCYGNAAVNTYQGGAKGAAWVGYTGVYHGGTPTTLSIVDSTSNANDCTLPGGAANPTATTGQFGGGILFTAANSQYLSCGTNSAFGISGSGSTFTLEAWTQQTPGVTGVTLVGSYGGGYGDTIELVDGIYWRGSSAGVNAWAYSSPGTYSTGLLYYVAAIYNAGTNNDVYINGVGSGSPTTQTEPFTGSDPFGIGKEYSGFYSSGWEDEVRVSNSVRPAGYFATTYANLSSVTAFAVVSAIGPLGGGATSVTLTPIII